MSELNLIKTVLFNSVTLNEALTRLTELGIQYRACTFTENGYHVTGYDITFWPTQSLRCPLAVCINGSLFDYDDRTSFLAGKPETVETSVPAASPENACQRPILFTALRVISGLNTSQFKLMLRNERRLQYSRVKGLSS